MADPTPLAPAALAYVFSRMVLVADQLPPRGGLFLVHRDGKFFTCTVCYGMHEPWFVTHILSGSVLRKSEADPVPMKNDDLWVQIR